MSDNQYGGYQGYRGGRGRGRGRGRGGGGRGMKRGSGHDEHGRGRGRGQGRHPPGLTGREIGMWYAKRGRGNKKRQKERELRERGRVNMDEEQERRITRMLREVELLRSERSQLPGQRNQRGLRPYDVMCQNFYTHALTKDAALDTQLKEEFAEKQSNLQYKRMQEFRQKLPSYSMREKLLSLINENQVVVISGETGCGKTTQVPQFILDDHIQRGQGSTCRVICTQPRRISAISVAERVAAERAERCGHSQSTGYQIRLENAFPRTQGCILYCTTGILLKWLENDKLLKSVSHIVLDEVHERDKLCDFLLIILKDLLPKRPNLKLILMSATLKAELFSEYFGNSPMVNIPGFTFPVIEYYLEDVLEQIGYEPAEMSTRRRGPPIWLKFKKGREAREDERRKEEEFRQKFEEYIKALRGSYSERVINILTSIDHDNLDLDLAASLIKHICLHKPDGAILVFLPGWDKISTLHNQLSSQRFFSQEKFQIIPLHSMMPTVNQRQVFDRPPPGVRKIIIATNIAETSITIDDVVYVVNMGKVKEHNFDTKNNISTLKAEWISKASARQRRGRAGRVQKGECYHVYSQLKASLMEDYQLPEMQRTPLEELCLNIKTLKLGRIVPFISKAMQPPDMEAIVLAIKSLKQMHALDDDEELTPLGYHLSRLPVEPRIGKMMLFGAMFCCLDPILTIAACLGWKDPFIIPLGKEKLADERRKVLANGTCSDHLMVCNAFTGWEEARAHGRSAENSYCWSNFLSISTLNMLDKMKGQFCDLLYDLNFVTDRSPKHPAANRNSENIQLLKAVLCAGIYPKIAHVYKVSFGQRRGKPIPPKLRTVEDGRVQIHPKSVNATETNFTSKWLLYHLKLKSSSVFLHDTSMVEPYPLLFFGGKISWDEEDGYETVYVDDAVKFHCSQATADLVIKLRQELDGVLEQKITSPGVTNWRQDTHEGKVMRAIVDLLVMEAKETQDLHDDYDDDDDDDDFDGRDGRNASTARNCDDYDDNPGRSNWRTNTPRHRQYDENDDGDDQRGRYWNRSKDATRDRGSGRSYDDGPDNSNWRTNTSHQRRYDDDDDSDNGGKRDWLRAKSVGSYNKSSW